MTNRLEEQRIDAEIHRAADGSDPFAAAVRATRMPMLITDPRQPDNPIVFVNDAFARLTGYDRSETLGHNCRFLQGPDTNKDDVARVREAIAERVPVEIELLNYRKDGTTFWNRLLISPVFDGGELTYFFASQFDITVERERYSRLAADRRELEAQVESRMAELKAAEDKLRFILSAARLGTWTLDVPTGRLVASEQCRAMFGHPDDSEFSLSTLEEGIAPGDRRLWKNAFGKALVGDGYAEAEVRLFRNGADTHWVEMRANTRFDENRQPVSMIGVVIDITDRRAAEVHRDLLTRELSHRVKNTLATVQAIVGRSLRENGVDDALATKISDRLRAIAGAHDVLTHHGWSSADIGEIVAAALAPFNFEEDRIEYGGADVLLSARAATSLALALHELATNAFKFGSLSRSTGKVSLKWDIVGDDMRLVWTETGGPEVSDPERRGFGSLLIDTMLASSTYGSTDLDYRPGGLVFTYTAPLATLVEKDSQRAY